MSGSQPLHGNQMRAVAPEDTVWLSASAGTGKTQVLSSRVLRLLLQPDVEPSQILCLTFTKAGATEMASRISERLASWVRLPDGELFHELDAIGAPSGPEQRARARTLFAAVLDCPGGGLRIDTIHAFSQWLLGAFPLEARLVPGSRAMEDRERILLQRQVLADLLVEAESDPLGDPQLLDALAALSLRLGPDETEQWLMRCAAARDLWFGPGSWQANDMRAHVNRRLGLDPDASSDDLAALCADDRFDTLALRRCLESNRAWKAKSGQDNAAIIADWLACDPHVRSRGIDGLYDVFHTKKGTLRASSSQEKIDPDYPRHVERVAHCIARVRELQTLLALAGWLVPALRLGRAFALAWDEAKAREGLIDFDDQIRLAAELLTDGDYAQWIGYKLDRRFDHILVDEAQDTNAAQWRIIDALTREFFAGEGQRGDRMRTLFVVGDYKQAIFRFQGTSPENFEAARLRVKEAMLGAAASAANQRANIRAAELRELGLAQSFRTAEPILKFVDAVIETIGIQNISPGRPADPHRGLAIPGHVSLWRPIGQLSGDPEDEEDGEGPDWLSDRDRTLADRIACQVKAWTEADGPGFLLSKGGAHRAGPGDIMVLVRKRGALAGLIVARLHAHGVPVAGVDRLRLGAPLAVKDLVAALRFAAQPFDDLTLAALLVSPLVGWSQDQLLEHSWREKGVHLWDHLRRSSHPHVAAVLGHLGELLARADFEPPQALLHWLLSGPWQGRRRLIERLGREANDPIDELLNAAHAYAMGATPSLAGFLAWFDAGDGELKREADNAAGLVRVMTVHGAKGLQAPIVILADATGNPDAARKEALDLTDPRAPDERAIPLPKLRGEEEVGPIAQARERATRESGQEHWRLLYVAMTRAEEALFIGGALTVRDKGAAPPASWYARLAEAMSQREEIEDPIWGRRIELGDPLRPAPAGARSPELPMRPPLPAWLTRAPPEEPRPPRPLAPSALGEDASADPPYPPGASSDAARRGVMIHKLLERLPDVPREDRIAAGRRWLTRNAPGSTQEDAETMLRTALDVIETEAWQELFSPAALAEVPIAATVGGRVVVGTIDRLLIDPTRIRLIDYKTARRPPEGIDGVPAALLRQMAAYAAALEVAYPGRQVEAALLYTAVPRLIAIPPDVLARHKQHLLAVE